MILTIGDVYVGTQTVWMEARGEPFDDKKAVAHVMRNRMEFLPGDRWNTIAQVCLDWLQFSGWRENDPNFKKAQTLNLSDPVVLECLHAFVEAMREPDTTFGARHYHTAAIEPGWAVGKTPCLTMRSHLFYNNVR